MADLDWVPEEVLKAIELEKDIDGDTPAIEKVERELRDNALMAAKSITYLSAHSLSEGVRLGASKYIVDRVMAGRDAMPKSLVEAFLEDVVIHANSE